MRCERGPCWAYSWRWGPGWVESRPSRADEDPSASLIGSWSGTRRGPGATTVRHNLLSFLPGGVALESGPSVYVTGVNFANGSFLETGFVGTWVSEGHGNFVAHLIANISEPPVSKGTVIGTENLTFRFHVENGKNGKELKGTIEGVFLDPRGKHDCPAARRTDLGGHAADGHVEWI